MNLTASSSLRGRPPGCLANEVNTSHNNHPSRGSLRARYVKKVLPGINPPKTRHPAKWNLESLWGIRTDEGHHVCFKGRAAGCWAAGCRLPAASSCQKKTGRAPVCVCACACVCTHLCTHTHTLYIYLCIYIFSHTQHIPSHTHNIGSCTHTTHQIHSHTDTHHTHSHTHTTYTHTHEDTRHTLLTHASSHTYSYTHIKSCTRTQQTRIHIITHTHTHVHLFIQALSRQLSHPPTCTHACHTHNHTGMVNFMCHHMAGPRCPDVQSNLLLASVKACFG